jgi:hypothetical protein
MGQTITVLTPQPINLTGKKNFRVKNVGGKSSFSIYGYLSNVRNDSKESMHVIEKAPRILSSTVYHPPSIIHSRNAAMLPKKGK